MLAAVTNCPPTCVIEPCAMPPHGPGHASPVQEWMRRARHLCGWRGALASACCRCGSCIVGPLQRWNELPSPGCLLYWPPHLAC